jgi:hypothetical protein
VPERHGDRLSSTGRKRFGVRWLAEAKSNAGEKIGVGSTTASVRILAHVQRFGGLLRKSVGRFLPWIARSVLAAAQSLRGANAAHRSAAFVDLGRAPAQIEIEARRRGVALRRSHGFDGMRESRGFGALCGARGLMRLREAVWFERLRCARGFGRARVGF